MLGILAIAATVSSGLSALVPAQEQIVSINNECVRATLRYRRAPFEVRTKDGSSVVRRGALETRYDLTIHELKPRSMLRLAERPYAYGFRVSIPEWSNADGDANDNLWVTIENPPRFQTPVNRLGFQVQAKWNEVAPSGKADFYLLAFEPEGWYGSKEVHFVGNEGWKTVPEQPRLGQSVWGSISNPYLGGESLTFTFRALTLGKDFNSRRISKVRDLTLSVYVAANEQVAVDMARTLAGLAPIMLLPH